MNHKNKYLIGLGCSWTQGQGGYPDQIYDSFNGRVDVDGSNDYFLREHEHENSWVNQLCRDHLAEYTPINLGVRGVGNVAAVNQLHFCDKVDFENSEVIVIFMLSGIERLDIFTQTPYTYDEGNDKDDYYSNLAYRHYKYRTAWPIAGKENKLNDIYAKELHSDAFVAANTMTALLHLQNFTKRYNYQLIVANAYNHYNNDSILKFIEKHSKPLYDKFDWSCYYHSESEYISFVHRLIELDNIISSTTNPFWADHYYKAYSSLEHPAEHIANCGHPTTKGYKVIADDLAYFIKQKIS